MKLMLPYGRGELAVSIADGRRVQVLRARKAIPQQAPGELVQKAMDTPYGDRDLAELARGKRTAVLIASDHTRPVPSRWILPPILEALRRGSPDLKLTVLIASGCHRDMTRAELEQKFGPELLDEVTIVQHHGWDSDCLVDMGGLPSGGPLWVNRVAAQAELLIAEGFIEPHFFAGFSGGRKSVLPGVAGRETIFYNHSAGMIDHPQARAGSLDGNPIHLDMQAAADRAGLAYICNVILNEEKKVVAAVAGEPRLAHQAGCEIVRELTQVSGRPTPIVLTTNGGYPLDQNLYQCVKGISTGARACLPGGVIILCAQCEDGHGGEGFYQALRTCPSPQALLDEIRSTPPRQTRVDQWQYQILARVLVQQHVIMVTRPELEPIVREMHMEYAPDVETALSMADHMVGQGSELTVLPDGVGTIFLPVQEERV